MKNLEIYEKTRSMVRVGGRMGVGGSFGWKKGLGRGVY